MNKTVDIHAHVFNLNFIPVAGAIRAISRVHLNRGLPKFLCRLIAWYYLRKVKSEKQEGHVDIKSFEVSEADAIQLFSGLSEDEIEMKFSTKEEENEFYEFVKEEFGDDEIKNLEFSKDELEQIGLKDDDRIQDLLKLESNKELIAIPWGRILLFILRYIWKKLYQRFLKPYLDWINFMTLHYEDITHKLFNQYQEIDLFIHHDMDMDDWYPLNPSVYEYDRDQVNRMSELMEEEEGKLLCFYAYNPQKSLEGLETAILGKKRADGTREKSKGYHGVKFYPPSGYKPWYEDESNPLQKRNIELYDLCQANEIPVFTHCNYGGMQAGKDYFKNGAVKYWSKVMEEYPDLILCFGHSGGHEGWLGEFEDNILEELGHTTFELSYPGQIYDLCIKYPNVYCEFGYTPEAAESAHFVNRIKQCITESQSAPYKFEDKIIFGTDWHMLMQEHGFESYYSDFKVLFERDELENYEDRFFGGNALKYLKLPNYIERNDNKFLTNEAKNHLESVVV